MPRPFPASLRSSSAAALTWLFVVTLAVFYAASAALAATLELPPYAQYHLILAMAFGLFGYFISRAKVNLDIVRHGRLWRGVIALFIALLTYAALVYFAFSYGLISFTYADPGLEPAFRASLGTKAILFGVGVILGVELFFRYFFFAAVPVARHFALGAVVLQAVLYLIWWYLAIRSHLAIAESGLVWRYLAAGLLIAAISGQLYLLSGNILVSGFWTAFHGFLSLYLLNDVEFDFRTAHYLVASTYDFYDWKIGFLFVILILFTLWQYSLSKGPESSQ